MRGGWQGLWMAAMMVVAQLIIGGGPVRALEEERDATSQTQYDDVMIEFGPLSPAPDSQESEIARLPSTCKGSLYSGGSFNISHQPNAPGPTDHRGLSGLKVGARFNIESQFSSYWAFHVGGAGCHDFVFKIFPDKGFTDAYTDQNENELEFDEVWIRAALGRLVNLKMGRQTVRWGKAATIEVLDVLSPKDYRILGLADIEDLSLPVCMTRMSLNSKAMSLNLMGLHEVRFNKIPVYGSDFYPAQSPAPDQQVPESNLENTQVGISLDVYRHQFDFSLNGASYFQDRMYLATDQGTRVRRHSRVNLLGGSFSVAVGSLVLYGETAYLQGLDFHNTDAPKDRWDLLAGLEYNGIKDTVISAEAANRYLLKFEAPLNASPDNAVENEFRMVANLKRDFFYNTLHFGYQLSWYALDGSGGAYQRFRLDYDMTDHWVVTGGVIFYESGDYFLLQNIGDNDRLFFNISYAF
jgi:hypothetical protein